MFFFSDNFFKGDTILQISIFDYMVIWICGPFFLNRTIRNYVGGFVYEAVIDLYITGVIENSKCIKAYIL